MDIASATGMGWALNAGGDITRVIRGVPDEGNYGFPTIRMPDANDPSLAAQEKWLSNNICNNFNNGVNMWDGQPDLFYYTLLDRSGQFMLKNNISGTQQLSFMTVPYTPVQISTAISFKSFEITDEDGTQYFFAPCDSTESYTSTSASQWHQYNTTAWHVVKILSAQKTDSITFRYTASGSSYNYNYSQMLQLLYDSNGLPLNFQSHVTPAGSVFNKERVLSEIDFNNGKVTLDYGAAYGAGQSLVLNAIHLYGLQNGTYNELKRFTFYHSSFMSGNVSTGVSRLDSLQVSGYYNTSTAVKNPVFAFNYNSYGGWQIPPFNSYAQDFWGYFNGKTSNADLVFVAPGRDASGYPIPVSNASKRVPDSNYLKVGTLQSIKYPTGGTTVFDLEPNQINTQVTKLDTTNHFNSLNEYISTFSLPLSITFTDTANYVTKNPGTSPATDPNAVLTLEVSKFCSSGTNCVQNPTYVQVNDMASGGSGSMIASINVQNPPASGSQTYTTPVHITQGHTYKLFFQTQPTLSGSQSYEYRMDANLTAQTKDSISVVAEPPVTQTVLTGGLRIRKITATEPNGSTLVKQYKYTGTYFNSPLFNGNFDQLAVTSFNFDGWGFLSANAGSATTPESAGAYGRVITSYTGNLPLPLGGQSNNAVSYSEVEEYESDGKGNYNGKTVYDYGNEMWDVVPMNMPFFSISKEDHRSLLTEKRTYKTINGSYALLQDEVTNYTDLDSSMTNADTVVFYTAHALIDQSSLNEGSVNGGNAWACFACSGLFDSATQFLTNRYYYTTSRLVPLNTRVTKYESGSNPFTTTTAYAYQNPLHVFPTHTQTVSSQGKTVDSYTRYVPDQTFPSGCTTNCANDLQQQLAIVKQKYFPSFSSTYATYLADVNPMIYYYVQMGLTPADQSIYQNYENAIIAAENTYQQTQTNYQHAVDSLMNIYNSCGTSYNNCVTDYYNNSASADQKAILDMQSQNEITPHLEDSTYTNNVLMARTKINYLSYLPNVTMPATVQFATQTNTLENRLQYDKYDVHGNILQQRKAGGPPSSFQWGYNNTYPVASVTNATANDFFYESFEEGDGTSTLNDAKTGHYSSTIGFSKTLNGLDNGNYKLSYWQWNGSIWLLQTSAVTVSNGSYTINVTGKVDDIRFYPSSAQMTTYTYDPLVGMTSSTDAKGETTYYEYDGLQRLMNSRDKDGNIVKHMDYHYQGQ